MKDKKFTDYVLSQSHFKDWFFAKREWVYVESEMRNSNCPCGRPISVVSRFRNVHNGNTIKVGSDCARKLMGVDCTTPASIQFHMIEQPEKVLSLKQWNWVRERYPMVLTNTEYVEYEFLVKFGKKKSGIQIRRIASLNQKINDYVFRKVYWKLASDGDVFYLKNDSTGEIRTLNLVKDEVEFKGNIKIVDHQPEGYQIGFKNTSEGLVGVDGPIEVVDGMFNGEQIVIRSLDYFYDNSIQNILKQYPKDTEFDLHPIF